MYITGTFDINNKMLVEALCRAVELASGALASEGESIIMYDEALGKLREAKALLKDERDAGKNSRELSVTITEIDSAILWRQFDLQLKQPPINEEKASEV